MPSSGPFGEQHLTELSKNLRGKEDLVLACTLQVFNIYNDAYIHMTRMYG